MQESKSGRVPRWCVLWPWPLLTLWVSLPPLLRLRALQWLVLRAFWVLGEAMVGFDKELRRVKNVFDGLSRQRRVDASPSGLTRTKGGQPE